MEKVVFEDCLKTGEYGEHTVWNILIKSKSVKNIVDVRDDKNFQQDDIDFLVENLDRQFTPIEVKADFKAHKTGNIAYELTTSGNIGCFEKTKARYIYIVVAYSHTVYMIDVKRLRTYVHGVQRELVDMGDNSKGYLLPIEDLKKNKVIVKTYEGVM